MGRDLLLHEPAVEVNPDPTFHEFASEWFETTKGEWREKTRLDYEWQLTCHLLPFFRDHRLSQITVREIDRYRQGKVAEGQAIAAAIAEGRPPIEEQVDKRGRKHQRPRRALSATSINKTITRLGQILEVAVEYGLIEANPAKGRRRRLKAQKTIPVWLDRAEHVEALLDAAGELDRHAQVKGGHDQKGGPSYRRALLATLVLAGLRIGELTTLQWRDVELAGNRITVRASKTPARNAPRPRRQGAPARARRRRRLAHDRQQRRSTAVERAGRDRQAEPRFRPVARRSCPSSLPQPQPPGCELRDFRAAMTDRPKELELVDRYQVAAEFAHQFAFDRHRKLVELGAADDNTRRLLAESATIALQEIPAFARDWRPVEREWFEVELLDPAELPRMTEVLKVRFAELSPVFEALRARQDKIVAELIELLDEARRT